MVENNLNPNISFFFVLMHSPYVGDKNIINGHAIYNALLQWKIIYPTDISKISFGISQNFPISLRGSNRYKLNIKEEPKNESSSGKIIKDSILDNLDKGYEGFKILRSTENILTNPNIDYSPIPFEIIEPKYGNIIAHKIDYFIFYVIWKNEIPNIDFKNIEFTIGQRRNDGFGFSRIERVYNTTMNDLLSNVPEQDKFTTMNGIKGIYNHSRYGFGEYILETMNNGTKIIKTITPLCMNSTIPKSFQYGSLPSFVKSIPYVRADYRLWDKGIEHNLQVIKSGKVFEFQEN